MITSGFFPDVNGDRLYTNDFLARWVHSFISNGIYNGDFAIKPGENMNVILPTGQAWINGYYCHNDGDVILPVANAGGVLKRKDTVVLRWDINTRDITAKVLTGKFASAPVAPPIVRNAEQYDLKLAEISIAAGAISITQSAITDTRLDNKVCGIVHGTVEQVDTTTLYNQIQSDLSQFKGVSEADFSNWSDEQKQLFNAWFDSVRNTLDEDTAGHLLNLINAISDSKDQANGIAGLNGNGVVPLEQGGTGQKSLSAFRNAAGLGNTTGPLPIANGGHGCNNRVDGLHAMGINWGTSAAPTSAAANSFYIQLL